MNLRITIAAAAAALLAVAVAQRATTEHGATRGGAAKKAVTTPHNSAPKPNLRTISTSKVHINADSVVVRKGGTAQSTKLTTVNKGTSAWVKGKAGAYYKLKFPGGTVGYVRGDFLNPVAETPRATFKPAVNSKQPKKGIAYTIRKGDNDFKIAKKCGVNVSKLYKANPGVKWSRLQIGQAIHLPPGVEKPGYSQGLKINYIGTPAVKVNKDNVVVRRGPSSKTAKVALASIGKSLKVLGRSGAWYKVKFKSGTVGFIRGDYLNEAKPTPRTMLVARREPQPTRRRTYRYERQGRESYSAQKLPSGAGGNDIVAEAARHVGTRYVWGGQSTRGFDCSGFVRYVYRKAEGVNLPRTSREQSKTGVAVPKSQLKPGDVLSFHTRGGSRVNHSGIYIGRGKFIHASSGKGRVRIDTINSGFYASRLAGAHRVGTAAKKTASKPKAKPEPKKEPEPKPADSPAPPVEEKSDPSTGSGGG